jgi:phosphate/sulfate permease
MARKKLSRATKIVTRLCTVLLIAVLLCIGGWFGWQRLTAVKAERLRAMVSRELQYCAELSVVKNTYSNIVTLKRSTFFGLARSYAIVRYTAVARVGIADLTKSEVRVGEDAKSVVLRLPPVEVLSNAIVGQEVFDEVTNVFVPITTQELFDEIDRSRDETLAALIADGLITEAQNYTVTLMTRILTAMGFAAITVGF